MLPTRTAGHLPKFNAKPFERTLKAKATNGRVGILIRILRGTHHKWHTAGTNTIALTKITKDCIRYYTPMRVYAPCLLSSTRAKTVHTLHCIVADLEGPLCEQCCRT